jgi:hypothetical protein
LNKKNFAALAKQINAEFPDLTIGKFCMYLPVKNSLLRGLSFEGSSFDKASFSVTGFIMPLYVPTDHFYFTFGDSVRFGRGADRWSLEMPEVAHQLIAAIRKTAIPMFQRVETPSSFIDFALTERARTVRVEEALGLSLARVGEFDRAVAIFRDLINHGNTDVQWQRDLVREAHAYIDQLQSDPRGFQARLDEWEAETLRKLQPELVDVSRSRSSLKNK